jgi:hypothetical protein
MNPDEVFNLLMKSEVQGFQLSKRTGILSSTWLIYKRGGCVYCLDINDEIIFGDNYKYSRSEFNSEFVNARFEIDCEVA